MIVTRLLALGLLAAVHAVVPTAHAADYYVTNGGNDDLDGLSLATAWATLNHAADQVDPGDTSRTATIRGSI